VNDELEKGTQCSINRIFFLGGVGGAPVRLSAS
jgi:hypothetical protein